MADFSQAQIQQQSLAPLSGGGSNPVPVQSPSAAGAALNLFASLAPTAQQINQRRQAEQEQARSGAISRFQQEQLALAEAVDTGALSSQEARMRMRANYTRAISDNPLLVDDYTQAHQSIVTTAGLGKVAAEGTEEEQRWNRVLQSATDAGWIKPGMGAVEADRSAEAFLDFQLAGEQLTRAQQELTYERGQVGLQGDRLSVANQQVSLQRGQIGLQSDSLRLNRLKGELQAESALGHMAGSYFQKFNGDINDLVARVEAGELDEVSAQRELDTQWAVIQNSIGGVGAQASGAYIDNLTSGFRNLYESSRQFISGEITAEALERRSQVNLAIQTNMITGDPDRAAVIAAANVLRHPVSNALLTNGVSSTLTSFLAENGQRQGAPANLVNSARRGDTQSYLNILKPNMRSAVNGTLEEDLGATSGSPMDEVATHVNETLRSITAYQSAVEDPSDFNEVVDFFAGDEFREYAQSGSVQFDAEQALNAREVLQAQYQEVVLPLVRDRFLESQTETSVLPSGSGILGTSSSEGVETSSVITPQFSGGSFRFTTTSDSARVRAKLRDLNREVAPIMNRLIRSGAHLERHSNYDKVYNELAPRLFGEGVQE